MTVTCLTRIHQETFDYSAIKQIENEKSFSYRLDLIPDMRMFGL